MLEGGGGEVVLVNLSPVHRSCHCILITVLLTLATLVRDIINPSGSLPPPPSPHRWAYLSPSLHPVISLLAHNVGFVGRQSEIAIGNCQINFFLRKLRSVKMYIDEILPSFQGNMLNFLSVVLQEFLDLILRS